MKSKRKEKYLVANPTLNKTGGFDYVLKNGARLSNILSELPSGIVNKTETGIGATTLELSSNRNSIIVLPTIQTAKSKGVGKVHYFSSEASTSGKIRTKGKRDFLEEYLKKMEGEYKKFTVVADSLPQLLSSLGDNVYSEYFLLLDEIDSIQKDSTFRKRMETCMEYYKSFPKDKRAVVSATIIAFSDPLFKDETLTNFKYEKSIKGKVLFTQSETLVESAVEKIIQCIGTEKVVVAVNEIDSILSMANYIVDNNILPKEDIAILCGKSPKNKKRTQEFNTTNIDNNKYPCRLNFLTSAYFTGYDIDESYRLIVVSNPRKNHLRLSEYEIQQIIGRCRKPNKLYSIDVLYSTYTKPVTQEESNIEKLILFSKTEIKALNCISNHYESDEIGKTKAEQMREMIAISSGFENFNFIHKNSSGEYVTSYLNIDAYIEDQRVKNTVYNDKYLSKYFESIGYTTEIKEHYSSLLVEEQDAKKKELQNSHAETLAFLFSKKKIEENVIKHYMKSADILSIFMCGIYLKFSSIISKKKIKEVLSSANTYAKLKKLDLAFDAFSARKTDFTKRNFLSEFPKGMTLLPHELEQKIEDLMVVKLKQVEKNRYSKSKCKKLFNSYIELAKTTKTVNGRTVKAYLVKSHNPFNFTKS